MHACTYAHSMVAKTIQLHLYDQTFLSLHIEVPEIYFLQTIRNFINLFSYCSIDFGLTKVVCRMKYRHGENNSIASDI